ncbi:hypothetical protein [Rhodoferax sp.]|uniref:hypothetical protein n=1 Tax=Rhodoferax sp. TaxID=50421 RepID=UPI002851F155|nr:hypothetical protein [Rhodoferax sp.]MDR3370394.1 hypothetical protein [Rhodoferax sp.]
MLSSSNLDELAFEFFREFSRCEYCLKVVGLREANRKDPTADWGAFANGVRAVLETPGSTELKVAIRYFVEHPPKKQIAGSDGLLDWKDVLPDHKHQAELILRLVCRVRNNLFHGGKFNGHWFEPQRSDDLLRHALVILAACISNHEAVQEAYAQKAV